MKKNYLHLLILLILALFCVTFSGSLGLLRENYISETPIKVKEISNTTVNTVSILDINKVMKMTSVNYLADEFAGMDEMVSNSNAKQKASKKGTYRFYIDTLLDNEWNNVKSLDYLLKPDGNWHLTMYIPIIFSSCSVYVQYQNKTYVGSIDKYNIAYYTGFSSVSKYDDSVSHETKTEPLYIDIPISSERKYSRECMVTIHYETDNDNYIGIEDEILIGEDSLIRKMTSTNRSFLFAGAAIGVGTFLMFVFICILKHSLTFIPQLLYATSIFALMFTTYLLFNLSSIPYVLLGIRYFSINIMLLISMLYFPKKIRKIPVFYISIAISSITSLLAFALPLCMNVSVHSFLYVFYMALTIINIVIVAALSAYDILKGKSLGLRLNGIIACFLASSLFTNNKILPLIVLSEKYWLCIIMLCITIVLGFSEFTSIEIRNRYLTTNLENEVEKQTLSLQNVLNERDKLLLYISHDMKKTAVVMYSSLIDLKQSLIGKEYTEKINYILQKSEELKKDFADVGKYGKQNYIAEQSKILDLSQMIYRVTDDLRPDCEANGIILNVTFPDKLYVYAKERALESVIINLILNAIEHSYCSNLDVIVSKKKGICKIDIIDDGKGITIDKNIFDPFVSENTTENNSGLGLFLAKTAIESMHGTLTYERKNNLTIFSATLPLA